jgi:hypothetical protein
LDVDTRVGSPSFRLRGNQVLTSEMASGTPMRPASPTPR